MYAVHRSAVMAKKRKQTRRPAAPVSVVAAHPLVLAEARRLASGRDVRLSVQKDGSILIVNGVRP